MIQVDQVTALLKADEAIAAIVGNDVHEDAFPRGSKFPAIVVSRASIGDGQTYDTSGPTKTREDQIQTDIYGRTPEEKRTLTNIVRELLRPLKGSDAVPGLNVQACFLQTDRDLPFVKDATTTGNAFRSVLVFRFVTNATE